MRRIDAVILTFISIIAFLLVAAWIFRLKGLEQYLECKRRLLGIGIALANYHETYGAFPSGTVLNSELSPEQRCSWFMSIMPYVEAKTPYVDVDKGRAWNSEGNIRLIQGAYKPFLCPASSLNKRDGPGLSSYVGIAGLGSDAPILPRTDPNAGIFGYDNSAKLHDIADGQSSTMMVAETLSGNGPWAAGGFSTVRGINVPDSPLIGKDRQLGSRHLFTSTFAINQPSSTNVLFADGSVRPLMVSTDSIIVGAMATIAGHDAVLP